MKLVRAILMLAVAGGWTICSLAQTPSQISAPPIWDSLRNPRIVDADTRFAVVEHSGGMTRIPWAQMPAELQAKRPLAPGTLRTANAAATKAPSFSLMKAFFSIIVALLIVALVAFRMWTSFYYWRIIRPFRKLMQPLADPQSTGKNQMRMLWLSAGIIVLYEVLRSFVFR